MIKLTPHITEKSYSFASDDAGKVKQYTFVVPRLTRALQVKKAVEEHYKVTVEDVRMINLPAKARVFKGKKGSTQAIRKAIVRLKSGQRIAEYGAQAEKTTESEAK